MAYAVVTDVPASWEQYEPLGRAFHDPVPNGLVLHLAGPTDEGFRVIDVWETREACERFEAVLLERGVTVQRDGLATPTLRELGVLDVVRPTTAEHGAGGAGG